MIRPAAVLLTALAIAAAGCGDDEKDAPSPTPEPTPAAAQPTPDADRYCALVNELDKAGQAIFEELERQNASPERFREAEGELAKRFEPQLDELRQVAPEEIADDVRTLVATVRHRGGAGPAVPRAESAAAEKRVQAYEEEHCRS